MKETNIEKLLTCYFQGNLNQKDLQDLEDWKNASPENQKIFEDSQKAWEGLEQLRMMKKYDADKAIHKVEQKINSRKSSQNLIEIFRKVAAVLILPLIIATIWMAFEKTSSESEYREWHTLKTPAGMRSEFILPDSTKVYLNSETSLTYPLAFSSHIREVKLNGEAYFEVAENKKVPFVVDAGGIDIEVTGTEFKASNYQHENLLEVVLVSGEVNLYEGNYSEDKNVLTPLVPGERFRFDQENKTMNINNVDVEKYLAWKDGVLMFRDDSMEEVVRRMNRWFNVDIQLTGPDLTDYVYTATFEGESLMQILELLKISAPINYTIKQRERKTDDTFSKMEIVIQQQ
jgi:ferric-dicitrate binding protein FerR (iron transport regulator)